MDIYVCFILKKAIFRMLLYYNIFTGLKNNLRYRLALLLCNMIGNENTLIWFVDTMGNEKKKLSENPLISVNTY